MGLISYTLLPLSWLCREQCHTLILLMGQSYYWPLGNTSYLPAWACERDTPYNTFLYANACAACITDIICSMKARRWNLRWELCNWKWGLGSLKYGLIMQNKVGSEDMPGSEREKTRISSYYNAHHSEQWKEYVLDRLHVIRTRALSMETYPLNIFFL